MRSLLDLTPKILPQEVVFNVYTKQVSEAVLLQMVHRPH